MKLSMDIAYYLLWELDLAEFNLARTFMCIQLVFIE